MGATRRGEWPPSLSSSKTQKSPAPSLTGRGQFTGGNVQEGRDGDEHERRREPFRSRAQYERAAAAQHAVIWGLSTGAIFDVVWTYRLYRRDCSSHGMPNWEAAEVIIRRAPMIDCEKARQMVDYMLEWTTRHHGAWFWEGLQGDRTLRYG